MESRRWVDFVMFIHTFFHESVKNDVFFKSGYRMGLAKVLVGDHQKRMLGFWVQFHPD